MNNNQDEFNVLRKIQKKPKVSQRELAHELGFSLGKLNYCLNALKKKGFVKLKNFKEKKIKLKNFNILLPLKEFQKKQNLQLILC